MKNRIHSRVAILLLALALMVTSLPFANAAELASLPSIAPSVSELFDLQLTFEGESGWVSSISGVSVNGVPYRADSLGMFLSGTTYYASGSTVSLGGMSAAFADGTAAIVISANGYTDLTLRMNKDASVYPYQYTVEVVKPLAGSVTWKELYNALGVNTETGYDAVTSATRISSFHSKDIPATVNKQTDESGETILTGVTIAGKDASVTPRLASGTYADSSNYGLGEFVIVPDDTVEGYVWNEYKNSLYAVTISDGTTTVGAMPWVDFYGEDAVSGAHYNKIQIALNNGTSVASNKASVSRYAPFFDENHYFRSGTYTVTLYADGYAPLTAQIPVTAVDTNITAKVADTDIYARETSITLSSPLPQDFDAEYQIPGMEATAEAVILPEGVTMGSYTLTIHDRSGKYADVKANFTVGSYVLMNIPYSEFYAAEGTAKVDAVSSATKSKPLGTLAANSYHNNNDGTDISGVTYPVRITDLSLLASYRQITDEDSVTYTVTNRGQTSTVTYVGKDALFGAGDHAYYMLNETPASYKNLNRGRGGISFGKVSAAIQEVSDVTAALTVGGRHTYYEIKVTGMNQIDANLASDVSAVTLTASDGTVYGLRHVCEIWRGSELGFGISGANAIDAGIQGKTISKITYYLNNGSVYSFATELEIPETKLAVSTQPRNYSGKIGDVATFTVAATRPDVTYQWYYSNNGWSWSKSSMEGATTDTLSVEMKAFRVGQQYKVVVTDSEGNTVESKVVSLTKAESVAVIVENPADVTVSVGETAAFAVKAEGEGLTYQWMYSNNGGASWSKSTAPGATTANLSIEAKAFRNGQMYKCIVCDAQGNAVESTAAAIVIEK